MQIVCPACAAAYEVPMTLLKPGRTVRCARCAHEWVPSPAGPEVATGAAAETAPAAVAASDPDSEGIPPAPWPPPAASPVVRPNVALRIAWAASIVAVLMLGWGAYAWRAAIMEAWPASIRLYAALGLTGDR
jgi:predicted Zn finger-like uncharacterized protein